MANKPKNKKKHSNRWTYRQKRAKIAKEEELKRSENLSVSRAELNASPEVDVVDKIGGQRVEESTCFSTPCIGVQETSNSIAYDIRGTDLTQESHALEKDISSFVDSPDQHKIVTLVDQDDFYDSSNAVEAISGVETRPSSGVNLDTRTIYRVDQLLDRFEAADDSEMFSSCELHDFTEDVSVPPVVFERYNHFEEVGLTTDLGTYSEKDNRHHLGVEPIHCFNPVLSTVDVSQSLRSFETTEHSVRLSAVQQCGGFQIFGDSEMVCNPSDTCQTETVGGTNQPTKTFAPISIVQSSPMRNNSIDNRENDEDQDQLSTSEITIAEDVIEGRRIVDLSFFWSQLHKKLDGHKCPFSHVVIKKHTDRGLRTKVYLACQTCDYTADVWTDSKDGPLMGINKSAVCGTITSGIGCSTLQEVLSSMAVPGMSHVTYIKNRDQLFNLVTQVSEKEMIRAAALESEIAIKDGNVNDGIPCITVVSDGAWAKRSFAGGKHDSLSGVGIIVGHKTGLVLYVSVRNKYCAFEAKAEQLGREPTNHVCFKNWSHDQSSTSMEKDIIVEGFLTSVQKRGLIYKTLISDGDSSVYNSIVAADPYGKYGVVVRKIECLNHLFRNLCKKFRIAATKSITRVVAARLSKPVSVFRATIEKSGLRIRQAVEQTIDIRNAEEGSDIEKSSKLQNDILQILPHVFGDHSACKNLAFLDCGKIGNVNLMQDLETSGIYPDVLKAVQDLSCHAASLLQNVTNNVAEACNSLVNKCNAGKRTNQCARNSYEIRCHAAAVQYNTQRVLSKIHEGAGKITPHSVAELEKSRQAHVTRNAVLRQNKDRPKPRKSGGTDKDYGSSAQKPDRDQDVYDILVRNHFEKLKVNQANRERIERQTILQSDCDQWLLLRTDLITASKFGQICRMLPTTSCSRVVLSICQPKVLETDAVRYGIVNEDAAKIALRAKLGKEIMPCGLFIDAEIPYLGASPDGLIDSDGIVEIKCPYSAKDTLLDDAFKLRANLRSIFDKNNTEIMNKNHPYYYQVQGQLHIANRQYCIFALWTSVDLKYVTVKRDDEFWRTKMEPHLSRFYMQCLLPEIVDSRRARSMPLREPNYIVQARDVAKVRKEKAAENKNKRKTKLRDCIKKKHPHRCEEMDDASIPVEEPSSENIDSLCNGTEPQQKPPNDWVAIDDDGIIEEAAEMIAILQQNIPVAEVIADIQTPTSFLNDSSIDLFLQIVQENSEFNDFNPASYTGYCGLVKPCNVSERDMQIIGGNNFRHWCCVLYDAPAVMIYDSLCRSEYEFLHEDEKKYIQRRYSHVDLANIVFMPVTKQPDGCSCGVYAAAFATTIALGQDPAVISYSRDPVAMRKHMATIIQDRRLLPFPTH